MKILSKLLQYKSAFFLIAANLAAIILCLVGGWGAFDIMFLYWCESAIIGFYNVMRIVSRMIWLFTEIRADKTANPKQKMGGFLLFGIGTLFLVGFFCIHYGGFMFGHLTFIGAFFKPKITDEIFKNLLGPIFALNLHQAALTLYTLTIKVFSNNIEIVLAVASLFISHGYSFFCNFIRNKEYINVDMREIMERPYGRIIVMHLSIIFGGFLFMLIPFFPVFLLIVIKTIADIQAHLKERDILSKPPAVKTKT